MRRVAWGALLALVAPLILAPVVMGAELTSPCSVTAQSADRTGAPLGSVAAPGAGGTVTDPFLVDSEGTVTYDGTTGQPIKNNKWHVDVFGIPVLSGSDANSAGNTVGKGTISVKGKLPIQIVGLYFVSGAISGDGPPCSGSGWLKLVGDPTGSVPWLIAVGLVVVGVLGVVFSSPSRR